SELEKHPLAIWLETRVGLDRPDGTKWVRAKPRTLAEAAEELARESGRSAERCAAALKSLLLIAALPERERVGASSTNRSFFAFKLHQFLSGAGVAFSTLAPPPDRQIVLDGQQFLGDESRRL